MKYKQSSLFGGHFGRHLEFQYEESTFRLDTQAKKFAHCITVNIHPSNLFSGGGGVLNFNQIWVRMDTIFWHMNATQGGANLHPGVNLLPIANLHPGAKIVHMNTA